MTIIAGFSLLISFFIFLFIGVPIAISMAGASIVTMLLIAPFDVAVFTSAQKMVTGIDSFTLLAVPFFLLTGIIMNQGGIAMRLVNVARLFTGRLPGSLAHTNIVGNMLFGSLAGSSVASAAAIGKVMHPLQDEEGYDRKFSAAVNIASAPTGLIIPPTGLFIIYSLVSGGTSVAALFLAGYIPGLLWGLATMAVAFVIAKRKGYRSPHQVPLRSVFKVLWDAIPSLFLIFIIIGGIIGGVFTATEASAVAVVYALLLSLAYRSLSLKQIPGILKETAELTVVIMFLIGTSAMLALVMAFTGIPAAISAGILALTDNPILILILINVILLLIGTFMDVTPAILIFTPIFLPVVSEFGMSPVHFGVLLVVNLCIGNITPPGGSALYVGSTVAKLKMEEVIKPLLPFYAAVIAVLMLITLVPMLSEWLPRLAGLM
ncbi:MULTISPECIES: TRAP transporter large permease [unclassified Halomonas]|uniref:TRAP transporter large permease n=1 Tax=unclassified Halomonas TaxID=2609666 RepID=UPI0021E4F516|nr:MULTISPECIES: TRAP transporter large permease [unclassified Halomonas]UYF98669.1 TRAP transporter large permease [Halomonas sp. GD1P12]WNL40218.1 TRAP transporter large permease [Halomonas sp. PAMB 3232]